MSNVFNPHAPGSKSSQGMTTGIVTSNEDPEQRGRVRVKFPVLDGENESHWARVVTPMAGPGSGLHLLPEVNDEVLVIFEHGRPDSAYVLGGVWNGQDKPPETSKDKLTLRSRSGHTIRLDDTAGEEKLEITGKAGQKITLDSVGETISIIATRDLVLESTGGKLILKGAAGVEITSGAAFTAEATTNMELKAPSGQVNVQGVAINLN